MKTLFKSLVMIAAAAVTLAGCTQKEVLDTPKDGELVTLKFNIRNADEGTVTKALLGTESGKNFLNWEDGDQIGTFSVGSFSGNQSVSNNNAGTVEVAGDNYTLNVQTYNAGDITNIYSYYPYSASAGKDKAAAVVTIPEAQTMSNSGFDADAMPMAGAPVTVSVTTAAANTDTPCGTINFSNLGSIIKFRVYTSASTTETLTSVTYKATGIGGAFTIDLTSVNPDDETTLELTASNAINEITTSVAGNPAISGLDNAIDVYMVVAPGDYTGSQVIVTTNAHTYTLDASGTKSFTRSHVKPIKVDIENGVQGELPAAETWTKVTKASDFTAGTYYILRGDGAYYLPNAVASSGAPACVAYTAAATIPNAMRWTATAGTDGLIFESAANAGNYLWGANTNNGVRVNTTSTASGATKEWKFTTVTVGETTYYTAYAYATRYLTSYGNQDWRNYTSASTTNIPAEFYKLNQGGTPTPTNYAVTWTDPTETGCSITATVNNTAIDSGDEFASGTEVTITATAGTDYTFGGWTVTGATAADATAATTTFTIGDSAVSFSATFNSTVVSATALPYEETFASDKGDFTIDNVALDGLTYVWSHDSSNKYMKASGYASSANHDVESWLVSPLLEIPTLSTGETIKLKFTQCINKYFGTVADEATLMVKEESGSWTNVAITYPTLSGNWSSFEAQIVDLSSYAGKNIQFAFKYTGTSSANGTWEIKDVSVKKYEPKALSSISVDGQTTIFTKDDAFVFGGTVTATYNDETTADVTASATFTGYDMSTTGEQTVTVSYTESGVTKTTTYTITVNSGETEAVVYTLDGTSAGTGNSYAGNNTVTQSGISWTINGNLTTNPWRIGGKELAGVDRLVYSTTALAKNISKIEITHGAASNVTVNSMTVIVSKNADFSNPVSTLTPTFVANGTVTVNRPDGKDWSSCYYKIVYNITISATSNKFIQFTKAEFTGK